MSDPLYRQIADELDRRIESGGLPRGSQLPTELELMDCHHASRNTVREAVKLLISRGRVITRPGRGTFVVEDIDPFVTTVKPETGFGGAEGGGYASEVADHRRRPKVTAPRIEIQEAAAAIADELRLEAGSEVVSRHQQRFIDDTPWSLQTTFYPKRFLEEGATRLIETKDIQPGAVRYIEEVLGIKQVGYRDKIEVRAPTAAEIEFFNLPEDGRVAVFDTHQVGFDESGQPIRVTVSVYPADRNQFSIDVGTVPTEPTAIPESGTDEASGPQSSRPRAAD
jgi:GntR family transcriptional regulator